MTLSPIILFVYNRPKHTAETVEALKKNELASESVLYVFADGIKKDASEEQIEQIREVRNYIHTITGFKEIIIEEASTNKGLANSVIYGVTKIINRHGKAIVVEDDIITHPFFLRYMNDCLNKYEHRHDIYMIGGFNQKFNFPWWYRQDVYLAHRACSWGWSTWKDRWENADWNVTDYPLMLKSPKMQEKFNQGGNDLFSMLCDQMNGKIDSWCIRWEYSMYKHDAVCIRPRKTLVHNNGFDGSGVHCGSVRNDYTAPPYNKKHYNYRLPNNLRLINSIENNFKNTINPIHISYSIPFTDKIRLWLNKIGLYKYCRKLKNFFMY